MRTIHSLDRHGKRLDNGEEDSYASFRLILAMPFPALSGLPWPITQQTMRVRDKLFNMIN